VDVARHVAVFEGDELDECLDFRLRIEGVSDPVKRAEIEKADVGDLAKELGDGAVPIGAPCERQFGDREALAKCVHFQPGENGLLSIVASYYRYETVGKSDREMRSCLGEGGKWTAVDRDSRTWRRAKLRALDKKLGRRR
jgi:hypothetical protein